MADWAAQIAHRRVEGGRRGALWAWPLTATSVAAAAIACFTRESILGPAVSAVCKIMLNSRSVRLAGFAPAVARALRRDELSAVVVETHVTAGARQRRLVAALRA